MRIISSLALYCTVMMSAASWAADATPTTTEPATSEPSTTPATTPATTTPGTTETTAAENAPVTPKLNEDGTVTTTETTNADGAPPKPPTAEDIGKIIWEEFSYDNSFEIPFAPDLENLDDYPERRKDWDDFLVKLAAWEPGHVPKVEERVRNLLCVCVLEDIGQGQFEAELPLHMYRFLRKEIPDEKLKAILAMTAFYPNTGSIIDTAPELNLDIGVGEEQVRFRLQVLAVKMLGRMLGKLPLSYDEKKTDQ